MLKSLKVIDAEGKKCKVEFDKFLLAYRTTPNGSTGVTPALLIVGEELKTLLPELGRGENLFDEGVRDHD